MGFAPGIFISNQSAQSFQSPGAQYHPSTYWFWHSIPSFQDIEEQLSQINEAGFKTFLIQPRLAFPLEDYLSNDYLLAYRKAMEVGRKIGLTAGLYDDYNWNSGHAGGRTVANHDSLRECQLFWTSSPIEETITDCSISNIRAVMGEGLGPAGKNWSYEEGKVHWGNWKLFKALAYPADNSQFKFDEIIDVTGYCQVIDADNNGCRIAAHLPKSYLPGLRLTTFVSGCCMTSRMMNYLNPLATKRFIEVGYEPYYRVIGEFFGNPLTFIFFDQPHAGFYTWQEHEGNITNSLMYDEGLVSAFQKRHHYPLEKALLAFILPISQETPRLRCDFFEVYGKLAQETFFKPIAGWARQHGLAVAGHEIFSFIGDMGFLGGFSWIDNRCNMAGDYFAIDSYKDISTVDACNSQPQIDTKVGDSVAKAHGRRGCVVEQYYVSKYPGVPGLVGQWELTLDELRAQAIRHQLFGARQFLFHGFYQTDGSDENFTPLTSARFDFAPGINFEPWFYFHSDFATESARLSTFLDSVESKCDIAVLYPLHTYWVEGGDHPFGSESAFLNRWMLEQGYGFDIIDERQIQEYQDVPGILAVGTHRYKAVVLPSASTIRDPKTLDKLASFAQSGGLLLASGLLSGASQKTGLDPEMEEKLSQVFRGYPNAIHIPSTLRADVKELIEQLAGIFNQYFPDSIKITHTGHDQGIIWNWTGADHGEWSVALFNDSLEARRVTLDVPKQNLIPERWFPKTGQQELWGWFVWQPTGTKVILEMAPKELACFRLLKSEHEAVPHLVETSSRVIKAALDSEKGLSISILCDQPGFVQMDFHSPAKPELSTQGYKSSIQGAGPDSWEVTVDMPAMPSPIELKKGWLFYTVDDKKKVGIDIQKGWQEQGFLTYAGLGHYECMFDLPEDHLRWEWELAFPKVETALEVYLNQKLIGRRGWPPYQMLLPQPHLRSQGNHLEVVVANTGANYYYHGTPYERDTPDVAGIIGPPMLKPLVKVVVNVGGIR